MFYCIISALMYIDVKCWNAIYWCARRAMRVCCMDGWRTCYNKCINNTNILMKIKCRYNMLMVMVVDEMISMVCVLIIVW